MAQLRKYRVTGEWVVMAKNMGDAENIVENAVAQTDADLEECHAELHEDEEDEGGDGE